MSGPGYRAPPESISVIVPVHNAAATLPDQLRGLASQSYGGSWETIVVDNGSEDGSADVARAWTRDIPSLTVTSATDRRGQSYARNFGAAMANGSLLAFCDHDDVVTTGWLDALATAAVDAEVIGGPVELETLNSELALAWQPQGWRASSEDPITPIRTMDYLPFVLGGNAAVWTDIFWELGGFDERYVGGGEDVALCWKAQLAGHRLAWSSDALVRKRLRASMGTFTRQMYGYGHALPLLYREFSSYGLPKPSLASGLRVWAWIALHAVDVLRSPQRRGHWLGVVGFRGGRLAGSLKNRVLCL